MPWKTVRSLSIGDVQTRVFRRLHAWTVKERSPGSQPVGNTLLCQDVSGIEQLSHDTLAGIVTCEDPFPIPQEFRLRFGSRYRSPHGGTSSRPISTIGTSSSVTSM